MKRFIDYLQAIYHDHGWRAALVTFVVVLAALAGLAYATGVDVRGWLELFN